MLPAGFLDLTQSHFRWVNDDGNESGSTFREALDTDTVITVLDANVRLRIETKAGVLLGGTFNGTAPKLQVSKNGGAYADVNASSNDVRSAASTQFTDGVASTERLAGSGTFVSGSLDEVDGACANVDMVDGNDTEHEFCVQFRSADLADGDTLDFRLFDVNMSSTYNAYDEIPRATISIPPSGTTSSFLVLTAPGAGFSHYITDIMIGGLTSGTVILYEDTTTSHIHKFFLGTGSARSVSQQFRIPKKLNANKPINATVSDTQTAFDILINGYIAP